MPQPIRTVAVIGAGTMGGGIAALAANAGLRVLLLDMAPDTLDPAELQRGLTLESPAVRERIVRAGMERIRRSRPAALFAPELSQRIRIGNLSDDLALLAEADWIVEAIVERLEPKRALMARIEQLRRPDAIVTTNTSGIPVAEIAQGRSDDFRAHFLGAHFFNPPRYTRLLELIPTSDTLPAVTAALRAFAEDALGKGVVVARDEPGFIANRVGTFALFHTLRYALAHGYSVEEVDALTGPLVGNPSSATLRLLDLVGIDVAATVAANLYAALPAGEREHFAPLPPVEALLARGSLGNKSGGGFYQARKAADGAKVFWPLDLTTLEYRHPQPPQLPLAAQARRMADLPARLRFLLEQADSDRSAAFVAGTLLPTLAYAAHCAPTVATSLLDVDRAMEWGYNQQRGPLALWSAMGLGFVAEQMRRRAIALPAWVERLLAEGAESFYQHADGRIAAVFDPGSGAWQPLARDPQALVLAELRAEGHVVERNASASLLDLGDGVLCLEFHSKANTLDLETFALARRALALLDSGGWAGMVIGNQSGNFSAGANLNLLGERASDPGLAEAGVREMQALVQALRFSRTPIVAATHGRCLGGGAEIALACARRVALGETYIGLSELSVGLIPAGGGCKELLRRSLGPHISGDSDPLVFLQPLFETIALAKVSTSAHEARALGYLASDDLVLLNPDRLLAAAKQTVLALAASYTPPDPATAQVYAAGRRGLGVLYSAIHNYRQAGRISDYDALLARRLAYVLCGGDLSAAQWVPEQYILDLERETFVGLLREERTQARIAHVLKTGKPLRN